MTVYERSLAAHKEHKGKLTVNSKMKVTNKDELSIAYTPGVAEPCRVIADDKKRFTTTALKEILLLLCLTVQQFWV